MVKSRENEEINTDLGAKDLQLTDLLRFIWKWKFVILAGTLLFAIGSGFVAYKKPRMYKITTILKVMPNQIDSPANIKTNIELGLLDKNIKDYLENSRNIKLPQNIGLKVTLIGKNGIIKVTYKKPEARLGVIILNSLKYVLLEQYKDEIQYLRNQYTQKMQDEIFDKENRIQILKFDIENVSNRINQLENDIILLKKNTDLMLQKKSQFLTEKNNDTLAFILYNQTIQKNIELMNTYKSDISILRSENEQKKFDLKKIYNQIYFYQEEKKREESKMDENQYIEILEPAENKIRPLKAKIKMNIFLGAVLGFSLATLIAFISEYISNAVKQSKI
jgi:uncharacterized protein involved in exopolysaccharide biosynthesis